MVIWDQSKPISLTLKIEKSEICKLHVYLSIKTEIRQVYNPF